MSRKARFSVAMAVVIAALALLIATGMSSATSYYYTVDEFLASKQAENGDRVQIKGRVVPGSIEWNPTELHLRFLIEENGQQLELHYVGAKPDLLDEPEIEAVAAGALKSDGIFHADKLIIKCPSKYAAADTVGSDQGR